MTDFKQIALPRLILFDLDGTLVHFPHDHLYAAAERVSLSLGMAVPLRAEMELSFAEFDFFRIIAEDIREQFTGLLSRELHWNNYPPVTPFLKTHSCLEELQVAGFAMALATSRDTPLDELRRQLEHTRIGEYIEHFAVRALGEPDWTDKGPQIRQLAQKMNFAFEEMLLVGDTPTDILSAKRAGVRLTAALESGGTKREILERADPTWIFKDLDELTRHLLEKGSDPFSGNY